MTGPDQPLEKSSYEPNPLGPNDVEVEITHTGICHSDLHLIEHEWEVSYPLVPGHEIIGLVKDLGNEVKHLKVGSRVGIGWQRSSCHACNFCLDGEEHYCLKQQATCVGNYGGFATSIRVDSHFAFEIPDELSSEIAAPLLCAGITVFSPFYNHKILATMSVGVCGIGGLGHIALQFAKAFGCQVTAFSSTPQKEKEAKTFGANDFVVSSDNQAMEKKKGSLDFLLVTTSENTNWEELIQLMAPQGILCIVGAPHAKIQLPVMPLIQFDLIVSGSHIGSPTVMKKMLEFSARHRVKPHVEVFPMQEVNGVIQKLKSHQIRYRAVLKN